MDKLSTLQIKDGSNNASTHSHTYPRNSQSVSQPNEPIQPTSHTHTHRLPNQLWLAGWLNWTELYGRTASHKTSSHIFVHLFDRNKQLYIYFTALTANRCHFLDFINEMLFLLMQSPIFIYVLDFVCMLFISFFCCCFVLFSLALSRAALSLTMSTLGKCVCVYQSYWIVRNNINGARGLAWNSTIESRRSMVWIRMQV